MRIPKRADEQLSLPFVFVWDKQPVLLYQPRLLDFFSEQQDWLAAWLCEELLHLLLQHPQQSTQFPVNWAYDLATDLEVRQYLPARYQDHLYGALTARLHLDELVGLGAIYNAIIRLQLTLTPADILPNWLANPYTRKSHFSWPTIDVPLAWQAWWSDQSALLPELGSTPSAVHLRNRLTTIPPPTQLPWPVILRRFVNSAQRSQNRNSLRRPSRRFGTLPGLRRRRTTRLAVVLDTSGSIQPAQRLQFFQELKKLQQYTHEILVIEADHQVRASYRFTGNIPSLSKGGGSTSFDPALNEINAQGPFDGVIYLTDGEAPTPKVKCLFPLLWIIHHPTPSIPTTNWPGQIAYWPLT